MSAAASLPVIRLRLSCADGSEYGRKHAPRFAESGVFIPSDRLRPVGARVLLKIELLDRTLAYSDEAVVASHVNEGKRAGFLLRLAGPEGSGAPAPAEADSEPLGDEAPTPIPASRPEAANLAEHLFSDVPDVSASHQSPLEVRTAPVELRLRATKASSPAAAGRTAEGPGENPGKQEAAEEDWSDFEDPDLAPPSKNPAPARSQAPLAEADPAPAAGLEPLWEPLSDAAALKSPRAAPSSPKPSRKAWRLAAAALVAVVACAAGALAARDWHRAATAETTFAAEIRAADGALQAGRLARGADSALEHLVSARALLPDDPRLTFRIRLLADKLEELGVRALSRGDLREARVHHEAVLRADPKREGARKRLEGMASAAPAAQAAGGGKP